MTERKYKLTYFEARAMGEPVRYMFVAAGVDYENNTVKFQDWPKVKPTTPFGLLPFLEFDGHKVGQSIAICRFLGSQFGLLPETDVDRLKADATVDTLIDLRAPEIPMFAAYVAGNRDEMIELAKKFEKEQFPYWMEKLEKFMPDSEFLTGSKMTWADIFLAALLEALVCGGNFYGHNVSLDGYPKMAAIQERVFNNPRIAEYRKNRHVGEFDF